MLFSLLVWGRVLAGGTGETQRPFPCPLFAMDTATRDAQHATPAAQAAMLEELHYAGFGSSGLSGLRELLVELDAHRLRLFTVYLSVSIDPGADPLPGLDEALEALTDRHVMLWLMLTSTRHGPSAAAGDAQAVTLLRPLAERVRKAGVRIALYPHTGCWLECVEDAVRLARQIDHPNVGVTFNLCHWLRVGQELNLVPLLRQARPHLFVVTINGADPGGEDWRSLIQTLDHGAFDNARLLATLQALGYQGPIGLQGYGIGGDARDNLSRSMQAWLAMTARLARGEVQPWTGDEVFAQLQPYALGQSRAAFVAIEDRFREATASERKRLEAKLGAILESTVATVEAKDEICRLLATWGGPASLPVLARLLTDDRLFTVALAALHGQTSTAADRALLQAAAELPPPRRSAVLATLGARRCQRAVPVLTEALTAGEPEARRAAMAALGRIGTPAAVKALQQARPPAELRAAWTDACFAGAERLVADGDRRLADSIYQTLLNKTADDLTRSAALRGLARTRGLKALPLLLEGLTDSAVDVRRTAAVVAASLPGAAVSRGLAERLPQLPASDQVVLLNALRQRGDRLTAPAVAARLRDGADAPVRLAAAEALGELGGPEQLPLLAEVATDDSTLAAAAASSLVRLRGADVDAAMARACQTAVPKVCIVLIRTMLNRRTPGLLPCLLGLTRHPCATVREEALRAARNLAGAGDLPELLELTSGVGEPGEIELLAEVIVTAARRVSDPSPRSQALLSRWPDASVPARTCLVRVLGEFGGAAELALVRAAARGEEPALRQAAIRALAQWPDAMPLEDLAALGREAPTETERLIAFRGYVRAIGLQTARSEAEKLARYRDALTSAARPSERRLVLQALTEVPEPAVLDLIDGCTRDSDIQAEAAAALPKAARLVGLRCPTSTLARLRRHLDPAQPLAANDALKEAVAWIESFGGHITVWQVSGPYTADGSTFDHVFAPEQAEPGAVRWETVDGAGGPFTSFITAGAVNLGAIVGGTERVAYLRTWVFAPASQPARLQLGSDDGIKAWLNGAVVHANNARRALALDSDQAEVNLRQGWNVLMLKVVQAGGEWGASARFVNQDGTAIGGLEFRPTPPPEANR